MVENEVQVPGRKLLLVVLPYIVDNSKNTDKKVKSVRSFLAFPYGVLTIASHIRKASNGLHDAEILDLNIASPLSEVERLRQALARGDVDVIGFSMNDEDRHMNVANVND